MKRFLVLALGMSACACGSKTHDFITSNGGTGNVVSHGGSGGETTTGGGGGSGGTGGVTSVLAPTIEITNPVAATDPNVDPVLVDDQITVLCTVLSSTAVGAKAVDPSSVKITMLDAMGKSLKSAPGVPTAKANEYSVPFVLTAVPSGVLSFQCTASDSASTPHTATATVGTLVDRGPEITIGKPAEASAQPLLGALDVEFSVAPTTIAASDTEAAVSKVTLTVGGTDITPTALGTGKYKASVDFNDKKLFQAPPSGDTPIVITAANKRTNPGKATASLSYNFILDGVGPVISLDSPDAEAVIGRASVFSFTITDAASGVDQNTVAVKLDQVTHPFSATDNAWTTGPNGSYTFNIGAALQSDTTDSQVTVNVLATDNAGNVSNGTSRLFHLDNQPPTVDLDPPKVYESRPGSVDNTTQCSDYFDPVGSASPNDLSTIPNFGRFRSLVWDQTNSKPGQKDFFYALTNPIKVQIYVQSDPTLPLLYAKDRTSADPSTVCNEIYTGSAPYQYMPTDKPLPYLQLHPITPTGGANWGTGGDSPACATGSTTKALFPCPSPPNPSPSDMFIVIHHDVAGEPVVYAVDPDNNNPNSALCTGGQWDVGAAITAVSPIKLGWVCIAARAVDKVGNPGVSPPLRICLDDGSDPHRCDGVTPPTCTDNCAPPPHFVGGLIAR